MVIIDEYLFEHKIIATQKIHHFRKKLSIR